MNTLIGRVTGVTDSNGRTISYAYDSLGNRTQMTMPGGSSVQYAYDQNNRLTQILPTGSQPFAFTYDANGRRKTLTYPNGATATYTYDTRGGLTGLVYKTSSNATIDSFAYTLDATGNRVARVDNEYQYSYAYDATYRVTQCLPSRAVTTPLFQQYTENFTYDSVGNRLTGQRYGASVHSQDYTYDYENRLTRVVKHSGQNTDTITFKYDPFGRRIEKNVSTVENSIPTTYKYTYVYDNEDIILEVLDKTQNAVTTTTTTSYVHGPGVDEPLSLERNGQTYYYHADGLGSITSMTDSTQAVVNRYSYDSFGNVQRAETVWNDFTFTGREYDYETGLLYLRARYYNPEVGRFVSKDPIGFAGGDVNVYNYTTGNPVNWVDPSGLYTWNEFMNDWASATDIRAAQEYWQNTGGTIGSVMSGVLSFSGLLTVQESAETLGDLCSSTSQKIWAGAKIAGVGLSWYLAGSTEITGQIAGQVRTSRVIGLRNRFGAHFYTDEYGFFFALDRTFHRLHIGPWRTWFTK